MNLNEPEIMKQWDKYRKMIADGCPGSTPRDWFENLLGLWQEDIENAISNSQKIKETASSTSTNTLNLKFSYKNARQKLKAVSAARHIPPYAESMLKHFYDIIMENVVNTNMTKTKFISNNKILCDTCNMINCKLQRDYGIIATKCNEYM